ncbi:MAG TPA: glycosyltransferase family 25 protein [Steroidobacteraceae bacterium]|nr:glycosyltransferase family 25 protein [Steroidobacteraceae bacterium]
MIPTRIVVINLDRSAERLATFKAQNGFVGGLERFAAVDGRAVNRAQLQQAGFLDPAVTYTDGALGAALSHFTLWEEAAADGIALTVCEDDAVLNRGFQHRAAGLLAALPEDWDIVLWGWNFDSVLIVDGLPGVSECLIQSDQASLRTRLDRFQALELEPRALRLLHAFGMLCYSVTPGGARKLLAACWPIRAMQVAVRGLAAPLPNYGFDVMCNAAYRQLKAYVAFPPLAVSPNDHAVSLVQTG